MLRAVRLNNFVKFRNNCIFSFREDGAYFFVGENGSGKSSVLEAIRRCLSRNANTSFSRIPDESKPSYIICEYEMPDGCLLRECKTVFTSFLYIPDTISTYMYAKIVLLLEKNVVFIEFIERENGAYGTKRCTCNSQNWNEQNINKILKYLPLCTNDSNNSDTSIAPLLACLIELLDAKGGGTGAIKTANENSEVDTILRTLENSLVFTFGQRSLGPLQWSKSELIASNKRDENYGTARRKCEIINYFLSNSQSYSSQKEDDIFRLLTNQAKYYFYLDNDSLVRVKLDGEDVEVLKLSEGILEAKYLSLLLASTEYFTVLLEEPDRGMHPQMIKLIRDIVLPQVEKKTIIIVSHNPILISSWSIPRTYKFYKERAKDKLISKMVAVGRVVQEGKEQIPRLLASEDYVSMLFARNVIFVEGQSDFLFVKAVIEHIMNPSNETSVQRVLHSALSVEKTNTEEFRTFLASLHVVKLSGEKSKHKWKYVSRELGLSALFLLDRDAVVKVQTVDTCNLAAETVKRNIRFFAEAILKQSKVKSQNTHLVPKSENTQELHEMKENAFETGNQGSPREVTKPEQKKKKKKDKQKSPYFAKLNTVIEAMTYKYWNPTDTVNEGTRYVDMDIIYIDTATEKMKEVIQEIVVLILSGKDAYEILNTCKDVGKRYLQYCHSINKDLLDKNSKETPLSTNRFQAKMKDGLVSPSLKSRYVNFVKKNNWEEARQCLEQEGVFVWRSGDLEDVFTDIVKNFEWTDERTRNLELLRRHMSFARLGINLKMTKSSTGNETKLFMDDKVSDENIRESIVSAFNLCDKHSDFTQFILFLERQRESG
ncbi:hypothetical protein ACJMK2_036808 [Sinanodonta woodiana]|uniref:Endonuclease GajA/Old nuclease/RecF-like AAA domain-containing protein n=1 Tax=Sinanodonta woodiana TaxID=1069815 RepID=A0ABD3WLW9_SINWO